MTTRDIYNHKIVISVGGTNRGVVKSREVTFRKLVALVSKPSVDATMTFAQYMAIKKAASVRPPKGEIESQDAREKRQKAEDRLNAIKASAGYIVAGKFKNGKRRIEDLIGRSCVQIDIDNATPDQADYILLGLAEICRYAFVWHTTRSHCPERPRIRLLIPLTKMVDGDKTHALTRLLALLLAADPEESIEIPDLVSFRPAQIMYLPSISRDQEFKHGVNEGDILDPDEFLAEHPGWEDIAALPKQAAESSVRLSQGKMEDPHEKPGLIGAFCRTYTVEEVIENWLSDIYSPGESTTDIRYTYIPGSGSNGAVVYDEGKFIHSNHGTDPIEGSANAWDLARIHLFGHLDENARSNTSPGNLPSFKAMQEFAEADDAVAREMAAAYDFDLDDFEDDEEEDPPSAAAPTPAAPVDTDLDELDRLLEGGDGGGDDDDLDSLLDDLPEESEPEKAEAEKPWQADLKLDKQGNIEKCKFNAVLIVKNDKRIAPAIAMNELTGGPYLRKLLRFPLVGPAQAQIEDPVVGRKWVDNDTAGLAFCLAAPKKLKGYDTDFTNLDLQQAMLQAAEQNRYNPVLDKINKTKWDGMARVETLFIDYLGADDNAYHRELARVWCVAAVARLFEPGHEFQLVPIIGGDQGGGKTGFIRVMGFGFYGALSSKFSETQKMVESTQGKWIMEVPELAGFRKAEIEDLKDYFSGVVDTIRLAYRQNAEDFKRRCVYIGTTNKGAYLRDDENRRFCPVLTDTGEEKGKFVPFAKLEANVAQIWAEAVAIYQAMRAAQPKGTLPLNFTSREAKAEALRLQREAREVQPHEAAAEVIQDHLDRRISKCDLDSNSEIVLDDLDGPEKKFVRNLTTTTMLRQALKDDPIIRDLRMGADKVIAQALESLEGWEQLGKCRRAGKQARWWARKGTDNEQEFVPVESLPGVGEAPDIDDILG